MPTLPGLDRLACSDGPLLRRVPRLIVPDNLKSGVNDASVCDPVNRLN
ncbi:hypothetical protein J2W92_002684 [Rhizobium leguminosarum]